MHLVYLFAAVTLLIWHTEVDAKGVVKLRLFYYNNPSHKRESGKCCEAGIFTNKWCSRKCDNYFKICIKDFKTKDCISYQTKEYKGQDKIYFSSSLGNGVPNPITYPFSGAYPGKVEIAIEVWDKDRWNSDDLIVGLTDTALNNAGSMKDAAETEHTISGRYSTLDYKVKVYCAEDYYGQDCNSYCKVTDPKTQHYTCHPKTGGKVCHLEWTGKDCNQDLNMCRHHPCSNGKCMNTGPDAYKCNCRFGFTGKHCETEQDPCLVHLNLKRKGDLSNNATANVTIDKAWYRIRDTIKGRLASKCKNLENCDAVFPIYSREPPPEVMDGVSERELCVASKVDCCHMSMRINVRACAVKSDNFLVYQLRVPLEDSMDYCFQ